MVSEFEDVVFAAKPGDIVGPIKSQFGYHVIKVDERRGPGVIPLEEASGQARTVILNQKTTATVGELQQRIGHAAHRRDDHADTFFGSLQHKLCYTAKAVRIREAAASELVDFPATSGHATGRP